MQFSYEPSPKVYAKKKGRSRRHKKQLNKLKNPRIACPFTEQLFFYVELVCENEQQEQTYASFHWITAKKLVGKERKKFLTFFQEEEVDLTYGLEFIFVLVYLDFYYEIKRITPEEINKGFVYKAKKLKKPYDQPIAQLDWRETINQTINIDDCIATFNNKIWHQEELENGTLVVRNFV